ncbi:MAG: BlaI/MecI/CopY family transcriptional regulator [Planctomycetota bacterium]
MGDRPSLSKGELDVARVLWEIGPAAVRQVHEVLAKDRGMDFSTVQTYLRRLESKQYANSRLEGRIRVYSARAKPRTVIRQTVDELVDVLFGGETMPLVKHLIEDGDISSDQLGELKNLIERMEQGRGEEE